MPLDDSLKHFEGMKLIIQCADRYYYIFKAEYSVGMYINMKKEEDEQTNRFGTFPAAFTNGQLFDDLFDDI